MTAWLPARIRVSRGSRGTRTEWYVAKARAVLGRGAGDDKDIVILGRKVRWGRDGVELDAGGRRGRIIIGEMGIVPGYKGAVSPAVRPENDQGESSEKLSKEESPKYRVVAARYNYSRRRPAGPSSSR